MRLEAAALAVSAALALAAAPALRAEEASAGAVAPGVRGALVLEPGSIRAGDTAELEIVVATPPDHVLRPVALPASVPGFWILGAEPLPVEKGDGRWIHRIRVKIRARDLGQFVWPEQPLEIEAPGGSVQRLVLEGRPLEVVSVQPEFPGRNAPFGMREPASTPPGLSSAPLAAVVGFAAGLASVGTVLLLQRARRKPRTKVEDPAGNRMGVLAPDFLAREALAAAALRAEASPIEAADAAAAALRRWGGARCGADLAALTTPEIAAKALASGGAGDWHGIALALGALDDARFAAGAELAASRLRAAIAGAVALVAAPGPEERR